MSMSIRERVQKRRAALRAAGLRPVQIWVPDVRGDEFSSVCIQQAKRIAVAEEKIKDTNAFGDQAAFYIDGWT